MTMQIKEFAALTGVSVRTLHYYDEIGLLHPAHVDEMTGYRYYDEGSLLRMQEILFFRELDFSLKSISEILSSPKYDKEKALREQRHLLKLKKERLEHLIEAIDSAVKGEKVMKEFGNSQLEAYKEEVKTRWGNTEAYREHAEKTKSYSKGQWDGAAEELNAVFREFALCMKNGAAPESEEAAALVKKLQACITANYYTCTDEILAGLGQMYVCDERFKQNIDSHAAGTADFASRAIAACCRK